MKRQYFYYIVFLFFFSCSGNDVESFYVKFSHYNFKDKKVIKLSLNKERTKELQEIYKYRNYYYLKNDTFAFNPFVDAFSNYVIIGEDKDGMQLDGMYSILWNYQPFALDYIGLDNENFAEIKFISIENFFTSEEKNNYVNLYRHGEHFHQKNEFVMLLVGGGGSLFACFDGKKADFHGI